MRTICRVNFGLLVAIIQCTTVYADSFQALGFLPGGTDSSAWGVNGDGSVVVGDSYGQAYRWTATGGMVGLGFLPGDTVSQAQAVSADGLVVVGHSSGPLGNQAFRWTTVGGMVGLGFLPGGTQSEAAATSSDGSVVVGGSTNSTSRLEAFRWTAADGMVGLGFLPGGSDSNARGTSADGSVVVGYSGFAGSTGFQAFRWTAAGGMIGLGFLSGYNNSLAFQTNADGSVVVGYSWGLGIANQAFRWTQAGGMSGLGFLPGGSASQAFAVSADGLVVVGNSNTATATAEAFRWTAVQGMRSISDLLSGLGVDLTKWSLFTATGVSANGQIIVGYGLNPSGQTEAWVARFATSQIAGLTTPSSVQNSINDLGDARLGVIAQQHGLAAPLLGGDKPMGTGNEAGVFASVGSAAGGGFLRYSFGGGFSMLGGLSYAKENYPDADLEHGAIGALALQYTYDGLGWWRPFVEAGGWIAPGAALSFSRTYANGAGTATGTGNTHGDLSYVYVRAGVLLAQKRWDQVAVSAEVGRERMTVNAYSELISVRNPFEAHIANETDATNLGKLRLQWSHQFSSQIDSTMWVAGVRSFNRSSDLAATVPGIGTLMPTELGDLNWVEYGARVGFKLTDAITLDAFANGVSGPEGIATRIHTGVSLRSQF